MNVSRNSKSSGVQFGDYLIGFEGSEAPIEFGGRGRLIDLLYDLPDSPRLRESVLLIYDLFPSLTSSNRNCRCICIQPLRLLHLLVAAVNLRLTFR
jgi:hypothetical protein